MLVAVFMVLDWCLLSVTGRDHRARSPAMSAAHAAVLVGLVRLWHAHIGDRTRAEITGRDHRGRAEITGRDHLGRAEITGRDHLGRAEITRAEIVEGRDHRTPSLAGVVPTILAGVVGNTPANDRMCITRYLAQFA